MGAGETTMADRVRAWVFHLRMWLIRKLAGQSSVAINLTAPVIVHSVFTPASSSIGLLLVNVSCTEMITIELGRGLLEESAQAAAERLLNEVRR